MINELEQDKSYDYGLAILRMVACFFVILCHFYSSDARGFMLFFSYSREYAVSIFMIMTFIFCQKMLEQHERQKIKSRFERLLIPQIGWAIIYWVVYFCIDKITGKSLEHGISDLLWQIFTGHSPQLNATMWYQIDLIYITAIFLIIIIAFRKNYKYFLLILGLIALVVQYSGVNMIFASLRYELCYPLGRFAEMVPLAVTGYFVASENILQQAKEQRLTSIIIATITVIFGVIVAKYTTPNGYGYQGIREILIPLPVIIVFSSIPFEKLNEKIKSFIKVFTQYTMGIYCMHRLVATLMTMAFHFLGITFIREYSFMFCIIVYIICFMFSWIGYKLLAKTRFKALFN